MKLNPKLENDKQAIKSKEFSNFIKRICFIKIYDYI